MTVGTRDSSLDLAGAKSYENEGGSRIGRWITDEDEIEELNPTLERLTVDITFIQEM